MDHVQAVTCDMNAGFVSAFKNRCPHIEVVYDRFHLVKNFNDKVVAMVRKDEQNRLIEEGNEEAARSLKRRRYLMLASLSTLERKDKAAEQGILLSNGTVLFRKEPHVPKGGYVKRYKQIIKDNELFFAMDLVKEQLRLAFDSTNQDKMAKCLEEIIDKCKGPGIPIIYVSPI